MKKCSKCNQLKSTSEFGKNRTSKDGLQSWCKPCSCAYAKEYLKTEKGKEVHRRGNRRFLSKWRATEEGRKYFQEHAKRQRSKFPERVNAYSIVNGAIKAGKLNRSLFCESCGLPAKTEGHHKDYNKPLDIDWLCKKCYVAI